jgi:hypothetical protein
MSTDSEKKRIERRVLEQFRQLLPSFPPGEITTGEEPDFTVALSSGGTLGIELTELYREVPTGQVPPQSQEALRHRAVKRAQDIYDAGGNPFLHASVHFANVQLAKTDIPSVAVRIAAFVSSIIPPTGEARAAEPNEENCHQFPKELHHVWTYNPPKATRSFFAAPGSTWLATLQDDDLKRALESKEKKYDRYRERADKVWLVISCNGAFMSTWFDGIERTHAQAFATKFDRVFLVSQFENRLIEVQRQGGAGA